MRNAVGGCRGGAAPLPPTDGMATGGARMTMGLEAASDAVAAPASRIDLRRLPWVPATILAVLVLVALLAPFISPHSPTEQSLPDKLKPPAWQEGGSASTRWAPISSVATC